MVLMAFDGFAMNVHLRVGIRCDGRPPEWSAHFWLGEFVFDASVGSPKARHRAA